MTVVSVLPSPSASLPGVGVQRTQAHLSTVVNVESDGSFTELGHLAKEGLACAKEMGFVTSFKIRLCFFFFLAVRFSKQLYPMETLLLP